METKTRLVWNRRKNNLVEVVTYYPGGYRRYTSTGIQCEAWDKSKQKATGPGAEAINRKLAVFRSPERMNRVLALEWLEEEQGRRHLRPSSAAHERTAFKAISEFGGIRFLTDFTPVWLSRWDSWLHDGTRTQTSVYNYHKVLKVYLKRAATQGLIDQTPYTRFVTDKGKNAPRHALTRAQLDAIRQLPLSGMMVKARDLFLLMASTGMAYADVSAMDPTKVREGWYAADRIKTGVHFVAPVNAEAAAILEKYDGVPNLSDQHLNRCLHVLGDLLGLDFPLTSHIARHTFITLALEQGLAPNVVQRMAGHSSLTMTESYTHLGDDWVKKEGGMLL